MARIAALPYQMAGHCHVADAHVDLIQVAFAAEVVVSVVIVLRRHSVSGLTEIARLRDNAWYFRAEGSAGPNGEVKGCEFTASEMVIAPSARMRNEGFVREFSRYRPPDRQAEGE